MAQQIIDTGAAANDGTGEPLRDAFTAVNENFTEIYTAGPVGSNVVISGNTITVTGVNNNLVLRANGIGNIQANSTIMPSIDAVYDIGAPTQRVDTVYAQYFVGNGSGITGVTAAAAANISLGFSNVTVTLAALLPLAFKTPAIPQCLPRPAPHLKAIYCQLPMSLTIWAVSHKPGMTCI
jgi:hypothetical protein